MLTVLRATRLSKGMTVAQVCRGANCWASEWYRLEGGSSKAGAKLRKRLALSLDADEDSLFDAEGWPLPAGTTP